jgi:hypothetical protein
MQEDAPNFQPLRAPLWGSRVAALYRGDASPIAGRVWLPSAEADDDPDRGNPCLGIAIACILSIPCWIGLVSLGLSLIR